MKLFLTCCIIMLLAVGCGKKPFNQTLSKKQEHEAFIQNLNQHFKSEQHSNEKRTFYYSGAHTDKDGQLVIRIAGDTLTGRKEITRRINNSEFRIEVCPFPKEVAEKQFSDLLTFWTDESNSSLVLRLQIYTINLIPMANVIMVGLGDCSQENIASFRKEVMDSPLVFFQKAEMAITDNCSLNE